MTHNSEQGQAGVLITILLVLIVIGLLIVAWVVLQGSHNLSTFTGANTPVSEAEARETAHHAWVWLTSFLR